MIAAVYLDVLGADGLITNDYEKALSWPVPALVLNGGKRH
jgi:hypothetical protein